MVARAPGNSTSPRLQAEKASDQLCILDDSVSERPPLCEVSRPATRVFGAKFQWWSSSVRLKQYLAFE
eukprot:11159522-Lingulodinium_polyedra.AAC.1